MNKYFFAALLIVVIIGAYLYLLPRKTQEYKSDVNPANFVSKIDNKYFTLDPRRKFVFENKTEEGVERVEIEVTEEKKEIMGIEAVIVKDKVYLDGELTEDTRDWYAQDKEGNVWYFGEAVDNYEDGNVSDHNGSWEAGVDGAEPGIIMFANPELGKTYRQEYYKAVAEDMAEIISLNQKVTVPFGTFENCLQTRDWNPLEIDKGEYKYYCPEVGFVVLEEVIDGGERLELISS